MKETGLEEEQRLLQKQKHVLQKRNITLVEESYPERTVRLERLSAFKKQRLAVEALEERAARLDYLQWIRDAHLDNSQEAHLPLLQQVIVKDKMDNFHQRNVLN